MRCCHQMQTADSDNDQRPVHLLLKNSLEPSTPQLIPLRMRAWDLKEFGVIAKVIDEPRGGAHRDPRLMAARLKTFLERTLKELVSLPIEKLVENRYDKFRRMGAFLED